MCLQTRESARTVFCSRSTNAGTAPASTGSTASTERLASEATGNHRPSASWTGAGETGEEGGGAGRRIPPVKPAAAPASQAAASRNRSTRETVRRDVAETIPRRFRKSARKAGSGSGSPLVPARRAASRISSSSSIDRASPRSGRFRSPRDSINRFSRSGQSDISTFFFQLSSASERPVLNHLDIPLGRPKLKCRLAQRLAFEEAHFEYFPLGRRQRRENSADLNGRIRVCPRLSSGLLGIPFQGNRRIIPVAPPDVSNRASRRLEQPSSARLLVELSLEPLCRFEEYLRRHVLGVFRVSQAAIGKTVDRRRVALERVRQRRVICLVSRRPLFVWLVRTRPPQLEPHSTLFGDAESRNYDCLMSIYGEKLQE